MLSIPKNNTDISNVLVIGCGGAGLRAAIESRLFGLSVKIIGKRCKNDAHTVLAAGGINAAFGNLDEQDNWEEHFADTFLEGYGIGDPEVIEIMAKESTELVEEIDKWGANFAKLENGKLDQRFFGAHRFRRTCYSGDYTGHSILMALLRKTYQLKIPIYEYQYVTDLLVKDECCFGAISFNTGTGERTIHLADAVILCTGGHTRIWKKSSSRKHENFGDGYFLALKAGCTLTDMEMVQFHPTGMLYPDDLAGTLVTEAVRGEGGKLFNALGERFMINYDKERMELSTRDKVAIANYTEIIEGRATKNGGVFLDITHKDKDFILKKIPNIYRQFLETQMLDISKNPMEVAPTAHYSMGGIKVSAEEHATNIQGLFAAGEVAGGLHGANRLGGNSLAEILVFGRRAGRSAAIYSQNLKSQIRCNEVIKSSHENIDRVIKKGSELSIPLINELRDIMWKYCGVIKNENQLKIGLKKLEDLSSLAKDVDVRVDKNNFSDLVNIFDFNASIINGICSIRSSLMRKESRGAHQRSDYKEINPKENVNYIVTLKDGSLKIKQSKSIKLSKELTKVISEVNRIEDFRGKLLE